VPDPVLHLLVGPNGSGKSTLYERVIGPTTHLEFVNADVIAADRWPDDPVGRSYDAAVAAGERRSELIEERRSFATETVFSHESKLDLVRSALDAGFLVTLHVVVVPEGLSVARVTSRVRSGGHAVPEVKVRERYRRLWPLVATAITIATTAVVYDNSSATTPLRVVGRFERGRPVADPEWPSWAPGEVVHLGRNT
jgi:predicted ABC-type ATPase